jgi:transposase
MGRDKKKARAEKRWIVFEDESGVSQKPPVRRTWAPRGCTPVLEHPFSWQNLSAVSFLCYRWDNRRHDMCFQIKPGSYDTSSLTGALEAFIRHMGRRRFVLVWDGLSAHRSKAMKAWLSRRGDRMRVERLPAYAPELNPVEQVWRNVKGCELANLCARDLKETHAALSAGMRRLAGSSLAKSFLKHAGLKL